MTYAGKILTVVTENNSFRLVIDGATVCTVPRTTSCEIGRYKAYPAQPSRWPGTRKRGGPMTARHSGLAACS